MLLFQGSKGISTSWIGEGLKKILASLFSIDAKKDRELLDIILTFASAIVKKSTNNLIDSSVYVKKFSALM
jgi:hypothetical protein